MTATGDGNPKLAPIFPAVAEHLLVLVVAKAEIDDARRIMLKKVL